MVLRILLIPVIAGVSYEFIRYAGSHDNLFSNILSRPGLWLQGLTTAEPDDRMIEVAIASVEAVFDWKSFVAEVNGEESRGAELESAPAKEPAADESGIEILAVDDMEEEDDEILNALDRYFEAPK